jgi:hypothetical protein
MNLEDELRRALRQEPAPAGFGDRILAKTTRVQPVWRRPVTLAVAAALALAAIIPPAVKEYRRRERGVEVRDQLLSALSITRAQLRQTREKIRQNTRHKI